MESRKKQLASRNRRLTDRAQDRAVSNTGQMAWTILVALLFGFSAIQHALYQKRTSSTDSASVSLPSLREPATQRLISH